MNSHGRQLEVAPLGLADDLPLSASLPSFQSTKAGRSDAGCCCESRQPQRREAEGELLLPSRRVSARPRSESTPQRTPRRCSRRQARCAWRRWPKFQGDMQLPYPPMLY
eukprot:3483314-Rhodomonas_salina.2